MFGLPTQFVRWRIEEEYVYEMGTPGVQVKDDGAGNLSWLGDVIKMVTESVLLGAPK